MSTGLNKRGGAGRMRRSLRDLTRVGMERATIHFRGVLQPARAARALVLYDIELDGRVSTGLSAEIPRSSDRWSLRNPNTATAFGISASSIRAAIEHYYGEAAHCLGRGERDGASSYCELPRSHAVDVGHHDHRMRR
jgi:hypothetical protein